MRISVIIILVGAASASLPPSGDYWDPIGKNSDIDLVQTALPLQRRDCRISIPLGLVRRRHPPGVRAVPLESPATLPLYEKRDQGAAWVDTRSERA
jgi:hypothetical protein